MSSTADTRSTTGFLGDTALRDYSGKLNLFNAFAAEELRALIGSLDLRSGMRVLDAGCGTGEALNWLQDAVEPGGRVVGIDLSAAHAAAARRGAAQRGAAQRGAAQRGAAQIEVKVGNLLEASFAPDSFDFIWCANTIHHLHDMLQGVRKLSGWLRPEGRIALGQSALTYEMYFAWDARLERMTHEAVRRYYHERYGVDERALKAVRSLVGVLRRAGLRDVSVRTIVIERISPLDAAAEAYLLEAIFRGTWGERLRPYLSADDLAELAELGDPLHPNYALRRPDFHYLQTFTVAVGAL